MTPVILRPTVALLGILLLLFAVAVFLAARGVRWQAKARKENKSIPETWITFIRLPGMLQVASLLAGTLLGCISMLVAPPPDLPAASGMLRDITLDLSSGARVETIDVAKSQYVSISAEVTEPKDGQAMMRIADNASIVKRLDVPADQWVLWRGTTASQGLEIIVTPAEKGLQAKKIRLIIFTSVKKS